MQNVIQNLNMKFSALILSAILVASITMIATHTKPAYAAFSVKMGNFETCAAFPTCDNIINGTGFQPKALILLTSNAYLPDPPSYDAEYNLQIGFSDGTNDRSIAAVSEDASNPTDACRTNSETIGKTLQPFCNSIEGDGEVQSFDEDGFTIHWSDPIGSGAFAQYIALGGADLTDVKVGTLPTPTNVTGNKAYTGIGFQPDFVMFIYTRQNETGVQSHAEFGLGFATSSSEEGAVVGVSEDGRTTSDTFRAQRTDRVIYQLTPSTGALNAEAEFVSFDSDGFTLNWIDLPNNTNDKFHYMAMKGGKYKVGSLYQLTTGTGGTCPAAPPNCTQSISVGFQPTGLFLSSFNNVASSSIQSHNRISFGFSHVTTEGATWAGDRDNIASSTYVAGYFHNSKVIRLATEAQTAGSSTTNAEADVQSFDTNGFTLNWTTADTTAREILYVAFGNA